MTGGFGTKLQEMLYVPADELEKADKTRVALVGSLPSLNVDVTANNHSIRGTEATALTSACGSKRLCRICQFSPCSSSCEGANIPIAAGATTLYLCTTSRMTGRWIWSLTVLRSGSTMDLATSFLRLMAPSSTL